MHLRFFKSLLRSLAIVVPCLVYLWAVGGAPHREGADLIPAPDAEEYALLAGRLAHFQAPLLPIGVYDYPSRYSLAYPALLAPAAALLRFDVTRYYLAAAFFGLLAVGLMARTGAWMLGSRVAGGLAAAFFALHPQTVAAATTPMSETGILMVFFLMLELARPWLEADGGVSDRFQRETVETVFNSEPTANPRMNPEANEKEMRHGCVQPKPGLLRAGVLGLALGWLTLAKAPFAYWAVALAGLAAARALISKNRRAWGAFAALAGAGLACALGDLLYRRWALGSWAMNGYQFWAPHFYKEFLKTFNFSYLHETAFYSYASGNLGYYGRMVLGLSDDFYGRFMAPAAAVALIALAWPGRTGRPGWKIVTLLAGWAAVGALFCGLYFYQDVRFPHLWVPLIDLLVAWGLVRLAGICELAGGGVKKPLSSKAAYLAALVIAGLLLRGEYRRVRDLSHSAPRRPAVSALLRPLLEPVPAGAWLFTNTKPITVELARPHPGPTGSLYSTPFDFAWPMLNMHVFAIDSFGLPPRRPRRDLAAGLQSLPQSWNNKTAELIGLDGTWNLTPEECRAFFVRPAYALVMRPPVPALSGQYFDEQVIPPLARELRLEVLGKTENFTLYRLSLPPPTLNSVTTLRP